MDLQHDENFSFVIGEIGIFVQEAELSLASMLIGIGKKEGH